MLLFRRPFWWGWQVFIWSSHSHYLKKWNEDNTGMISCYGLFFYEHLYNSQLSVFHYYMLKRPFPRLRSSMQLLYYWARQPGSAVILFLTSASRPCPHIHCWLSLFLRPNAWAPTLVGTKLLLPIPPEWLRKSARRWVTQVAVLHARFCAVIL